MSVVDPNTRPTRLSAGLATAFALAALWSLAPAAVVPALLVEAGGVAVLAAGTWLFRSRWRVPGLAVAVSGVAVVVAALALVYVRTGDLLTTAQFLPGMLGVFLLVLGLLPYRGTGSRQLVTAGTAVLFLSVVTAAVVQRPTLTTLLAAGVGTVLAWDAGENAIGVGSQLGRRARTWPGETSHAVTSMGVGALALVGGRLVSGLGSPGLPMTEFVGLLIGSLLLAGALHG